MKCYYGWNLGNQKTARIKIQGADVVIQAGLNQIEERRGVWAELAWYSPQLLWDSQEHTHIQAA